MISNYRVLNENPLIGRALLFRWIFDKQNDNYLNYEYETDNVKNGHCYIYLHGLLQMKH